MRSPDIDDGPPLVGDVAATPPPSKSPCLCLDCLWLGPRPTDRCPVCASSRLRWHPRLARLTVAHVDCDAFYAAVEKRDRPELTDRPVIVGHPSGRGVVTTACYVARRYGLRSAMPMFKVRALCPQAVVIRPDMSKYKRVSSEIVALMRRLTPVLEPVSLDEAYLDLSDGVRRDQAPPALLLARLAQDIERIIGITVSIGLAANRLLAKLASDTDKPRGFTVIGSDDAADILAPLPVGRLPGIGPVKVRQLADDGIVHIGQLASIGEAELCRRFGRYGHRLAGFCRGLDDRPVQPPGAPRSLSVETTFATDLTEPDQLAAALHPLCARLAARLVQANLGGATLILKLKTADFRTISRHRRLSTPTRSAEVMLRQALQMLRQEGDGRRFRLIGVAIAELCQGELADPPDLFDN